MSNLEEYYQNYLLGSFGKIEMTKLAKLTGKSHDVFTKNLLLDDRLDNETKLWGKIKPLLRDYENEDNGCIAIDDSLLHKPHTKVNDTVCWHFDHVSGRSAKGIMMLNFHYTDDSGISIPLGYEIVTKTEERWSKKRKKLIKKSMFTKNEIMKDKLRILHFNNEVKYKYILMDKWFTTSDNIEFIDGELKKKLVAPIKKNRKVALTLEDKNKGRYVSINSIDMGACSSRLMYLKGCDTPLNIGKQIVKNGNDDEPKYLYFITNDMDLSFDQALEIYQKRWKIEEYHKSLKQNLKIEHSPTKVELSQRNHINLTVYAFIKLEKLRLNYKMNHFAIKEKIYIEALRAAYEKVTQLQCA